MGFGIIVDIIAIGGAMASCIFWIATYQIKVGLDTKVDNISAKTDAKVDNVSAKMDGVVITLGGRIDNMSLLLTARIQRGQDKTKMQIGILTAEVYQLKHQIDPAGRTADLSVLNDALPSDDTAL